MKWDVFVYARGVQRTDGYKLRVQPENFPVELIQGCQKFFNLRSVNEKRSSMKAVFENDPYAWKKSFMFILQPRYKSCLLVRMTKVEADNGDDILRDFENRDIWSLEGIWCPYEKKDILFASLPSIIMWFANHKISLCRYFADRDDCSIDVGDEFYFNPYDDDAVLPAAAGAFETIEETTALNRLADKIKFAGEPFSFFFGPLTELMMKDCSSAYNVNNSFSTVDSCSLGSLGEDSFNNIIRAKLVENDTDSKTRTYVLKICTEQTSKKESVFRWRITENETGEAIFSGDPYIFDYEKGLNFAELKAEAEAIRVFARNMQWKVNQSASDNTSMYTFIKEK